MKLPWSKSQPEPEIAKFWTWFASKASQFDASNPHDQGELGSRLGRIHRDLVWGVSKATDSEPSSTLEISAGGIRELIDLVRQVVAAAPDIPGWKAVCFRQPIDSFLLRVGTSEVSPDTVHWMECGRSDGQVDLALYIPFPDPHASNELAKLGFLVLDHSVGEYAVMTQIGQLEFLHYSLAPAGSKPLKDLPQHLAALKS